MLLNTYTRSDGSNVYQWLGGRGSGASGSGKLSTTSIFLSSSPTRWRVLWWKKKCNPNHDHWQSLSEVFPMSMKSADVRCFMLTFVLISLRRLINVIAPWNSDSKNIRKDVFSVKRVKRVSEPWNNIKSINLIAPSRSPTGPTRSLLCENYVVVQRLLAHDVE